MEFLVRKSRKFEDVVKENEELRKANSDLRGLLENLLEYSNNIIGTAQEMVRLESDRKDIINKLSSVSILSRDELVRLNIIMSGKIRDKNKILNIIYNLSKDIIKYKDRIPHKVFVTAKKIKEEIDAH